MDNEETRRLLESEEHRIGAMVADVRISDDLEGSQELQEPAGGEPGRADQHPADAATESAAREVNLSLLEQLEADLSDIEHAMSKLDNDSYGTCEACGEQIAEERLEVMPAARFCLSDQARAEQVVSVLSSIDTSSADSAANTAI